MRGGISYNYNLNSLKINGSPEGENEKGTHSKIVFENSVSDKVELKTGRRSYLTELCSLETGREPSTGR
jgi:hypothetical protein